MNREQAVKAFQKRWGKPSPPSLKRCEACVSTATSLHHIKPKALGGQEGQNLMPLCGRCHALTHRLWGEGHRFKGPQERQPLIEALGGHIRRASPPVSPSTERSPSDE